MVVEALMQLGAGAGVAVLFGFYGGQVVKSIKELTTEVRQFRLDYEHRMTSVEKDVETLKNANET